MAENVKELKAEIEHLQAENAELRRQLDYTKEQFVRLMSRNLDLSDRIDRLSAGGGFAASGSGNAAVLNEPPAGNAEFYDPKAEQGGRFIGAITSDTGNMNMLINNDATVSDFWGLTCDTLAERHMKDIDRFVPRMAESWTLSDDKLTYRIKLRRASCGMISPTP